MTKKHTGFYNEGDNAGITPDNLYMLLDVAYNRNQNPTSGSIMLHGMCDIFAETLRKEFGYELKELHDEDGYLVHAFATTKKDGKTYYIDARGVTTIYDELTSAFDDFFETKQARNTLLPYNKENPNVYCKEDIEIGQNVANFLIKNYRSYYDVTQC